MLPILHDTVTGENVDHKVVLHWFASPALSNKLLNLLEHMLLFLSGGSWHLKGRVIIVHRVFLQTSLKMTNLLLHFLIQLLIEGNGCSVLILHDHFIVFGC